MNVNYERSFLKDIKKLKGHDGYPSISKQEAHERVCESVERYQNQTGEYADEGVYQIHISDSITSLRAKYANNQG